MEGVKNDFVSLNTSEKEDEEELNEDEDEDTTQNKGLSERCKFWPNCKNGDSCPFHHPTVPCRYVCTVQMCNVL